MQMRRRIKEKKSKIKKKFSLERKRLNITIIKTKKLEKENRSNNIINRSAN